MKLLITGASGLLGSDIAFAAEKRNIDIIKLCYKSRDGFISLDLTTEEGMSQVGSLDWDAIIHTAALKDPDICENNADESYRINVWTSEQLAKLAVEKGAKFVYISTDYVFSGKNPPYFEDSNPTPVNYYGETKLLGEMKILETVVGASSLRVPILYGIGAGVEMSALLSDTLKALDSETTCNMDDSIIRYPTYTGDVANAALRLLDKSPGGIFHFSGSDKSTKFKITKCFAKVLNRSMKNIKRLDTPPASKAERPMNSHLNIDKIVKLGVSPPVCFENRVRLLFKELGIM